MKRKPLTDKVRITLLATFVGVTIATVVGWLLGRDVSALTPLLTTLVGAVAVGEASNVGKRATTKPEVIETEERFV